MEFEEQTLININADPSTVTINACYDENEKSESYTVLYQDFSSIRVTYISPDRYECRKSFTPHAPFIPCNSNPRVMFEHIRKLYNTIKSAS
jgi:hypothetical protein